MNQITELINKIYNSEYFVIGLFILIAILAVIFIALILSGRKKKTAPVNEIKNEENKNLENNSLEKNLETINSVSVASNPNPLNNEIKTEPVSIQQSPALDLAKEETNEPMLATNEIDKMSFSFAPINEAPAAVSQPTMENMTEPVFSNPLEENVQPLETTEESTKNDHPSDNLFNTSIFHEIPAELANTPLNFEMDTPKVENIEPNMPTPILEQPINSETITSNLFEPAPDLSAINIENSIEDNKPQKMDEQNPENAEIKIEEPSINIPSEPLIKPEVNNTINQTEFKPYDERVVMPNQFSSVYINKEEPKEEIPKEEPKNNPVPPYDPALFTSIYNTKVEENISKEKANIETIQNTVDNSLNNIFSNSIEETKSSFENNEDINIQLPKIETVPPLEPINDMSFNDFDLENNTVKVNPKNTFDFELPNLAKDNNSAVEDNNSSFGSSSGFPNFSAETYDIDSK